MDLLVTGANGLLGSNVVAGALDRGLAVAGTYHTTEPNFDVQLFQLDIRDIDAVAEIVNEITPSAIINCAAMTDVDECERHPDEAVDVNATAPRKLARLAADHQCSIVHISTDYVFDGESSNRYREDSEPNPIQAYGRSKLAGERGVLAVHESPLVLRLSFVYGRHRGSSTSTPRGFPAWVRSRLESGEATPAFADQYVTPSRAETTTSTLLDLLEGAETGLYHVASRSCVTPYEFARRFARASGLDSSLVQEGSRNDVVREADRPRHTCLDVQKVEDVLGRGLPDLTDDIESLVDHR